MTNHLFNVSVLRYAWTCLTLHVETSVTSYLTIFCRYVVTPTFLVSLNVHLKETAINAVLNMCFNFCAYSVVLKSKATTIERTLFFKLLENRPSVRIFIDKKVELCHWKNPCTPNFVSRMPGKSNVENNRLNSVPGDSLSFACPIRSGGLKQGAWSNSQHFFFTNRHKRK